VGGVQQLVAELGVETAVVDQPLDLDDEWIFSSVLVSSARETPITRLKIVVVRCLDGCRRG
jgi:hypothetical protein